MSAILCPNCGRVASSSDGSKEWIKCIKCGTEFKSGGSIPADPPRKPPSANFRYCARCSAILRVKARNCHQCGTRVSLSYLARLGWPTAVGLFVVICCILIGTLIARPNRAEFAAMQRRVSDHEALKQQLATAKAQQQTFMQTGIKITNDNAVLRTDLNVARSSLKQVEELNLELAATVRQLQAEMKTLAAQGQRPTSAPTTPTHSPTPKPAELSGGNQLTGNARNKANWVSLSSALSKNQIITPAQVTAVLGTPIAIRPYPSLRQTTWEYRVSNFSGTVTFVDEKLTSIRIPFSLLD